MKRVGIITIQKSEVNYGASLQCYALWHYIKEITGFCQVIDLLRPCHQGYVKSPSFGEKIPPSSFKRSLKKILVSKLFMNFDNKNFIKRISKFNLFNSKIDYSRLYRSVEELYDNPPEYDIYITGSDQVWNPLMPFINDPYFLTFTKKGSILSSYASSFGIDTLDELHKKTYRDWLKSYTYISVRENSGADIVEEIIETRPKVTLDPVFLLNVDQWTKVMTRPYDFNLKSFVFLYLLNFDEIIFNNACSISRKRGLPLIVVLSEKKSLPTSFAMQLVDVGPSEWLWLIKNADMVITNSFHGTAFSIIFRKAMAVFVRGGVATNSRILTLLELFQLKDHLFEISHFSADKAVDYSIISNRLDYLYNAAREESISYLNTVLSNDCVN